MTVNVTLLTLRTRTRFLGDFENSRVISDTRLNEVINANIRKVWDLLLRHRPEPYITEQSGPPVTVANTATVALASNFYRLRGVQVLDGGNYFKLQPVNVSEAWRFNTAAAAPRGFRYRIQGANLVLVPTPTAVYTLRVYYFPAFTALSADIDTFDGVNGYEDLVIARSIVDLKLRESMPAGEWSQRALELGREVTEAASDLDAGEPFYLSGTGAEGIDEDLWWAP